MSKIVDSKRNPGIILSSTRELTTAQKNAVYVHSSGTIGNFDSMFEPINFQIDALVNKKDARAVIAQFLFRENSTDKKSSYILMPSGTPDLGSYQSKGWSNDIVTQTDIFYYPDTEEFTNRCALDFDISNIGNAISYFNHSQVFDTLLPETAAKRNWGILYDLEYLDGKQHLANTALYWPYHRTLSTGFSYQSTVYDISKNYVNLTPHDLTITTQLYDLSKSTTDYGLMNDIHVNLDTSRGITEFELGFRGVVSADNLDSYIESISAAPKYRQLFAIDIKGGEIDFQDQITTEQYNYYKSSTVNGSHHEKLYSFNQSISNLAIKMKRVRENTWYIEDNSFRTFTANSTDVAGEHEYVRYYISTATPLDTSTQHNYFTGTFFSTNFNDAKIYRFNPGSQEITAAESIAGTNCYAYSFRCITLSQPTVEYKQYYYNIDHKRFTVSNYDKNLTRRFLSCYNGSTVKYYIGDPKPENYIQGDMTQWVDGIYDQTTIFALQNDPNVTYHHNIMYYSGPSNKPYYGWDAIAHSDNWDFSISAATKVPIAYYKDFHNAIAAVPTISALAVEQQVQPWMNFTAFYTENKALEMWRVASADLPNYTFYPQDISESLRTRTLDSIFDRSLSASTVATDNDKSFFSIPQMDFIALEYIIKPVSGNS